MPASCANCLNSAARSSRQMHCRYRQEISMSQPPQHFLSISEGILCPEPCGSDCPGLLKLLFCHVYRSSINLFSGNIKILRVTEVKLPQCAVLLVKTYPPVDGPVGRFLRVSLELTFPPFGWYCWLFFNALVLCSNKRAKTSILSVWHELSFNNLETLVA